MFKNACALFFIINLLLSTSVAQDVIIARSRMFVNNLEFIVKGVNYNPVPLGQLSMNVDTGVGGTGLCSQQMTPWKQWKSACYDGDYFDGTPWHINGSVNGFELIWKRDLPLMVAAGFNTIRIFNTNPNTAAATETYINMFTSPTGKNHTLFMQTAAASNLMVIFPLYFDDDDFDNLSESDYTRYLRWQIDEVGNSSSLLMWQFGNEQSWTWIPAAMTNATIIQKFNNYVDFIKTYTYSRWGRMIPVTTSMQWDQRWFGMLIAKLHVDIFSANVYTTSTYSPLFDGDVTFEGFTTATCKYNKPFLITGFGPTYLRAVPYQARSLNSIWRQVIKNIDNGLIGAVYYEFTDNAVMDYRFGLVNISVAYSTIGSGSSTRVNSLIADAAGRKQQFWDIQSGSYNNVAFNLKTSPFMLMGRARDTLNGTEDICSELGTLYECPTTNQYLPCSGNGLCNRMNGTCSCGTGWTGLNCATPVCPGTPTCSFNGVCATHVSPPQCVCSPGFYGPACQLMFSAGTCPSSCSNNGICGQNGGCVCFKGWIGADCSGISVVGPNVQTTFGSLTSSALSLTTSSTTATKSATTSSTSTGKVSTSTSKAATTTAQASSTSSVSASSSASVSTSATSLEATSTGAISTSTISIATTNNVASTSSASTTAALEASVSTFSSSATEMIATSSSTTAAVASTSSASVSSAATTQSHATSTGSIKATSTSSNTVLSTSSSSDAASSSSSTSANDLFTSSTSTLASTSTTGAEEANSGHRADWRRVSALDILLFAAVLL